MADEKKQAAKAPETELEYLTRRLREGYDMQPADREVIKRLVVDTNAIQDAREALEALHAQSGPLHAKLMEARVRWLADPVESRGSLIDTQEFRAYHQHGEAIGNAAVALEAAVVRIGRLVR